MGKLNQISLYRFEKFLLYIGCKFIRQKGSHKIYSRIGLNRPIIIPIHAGDLPIYVIKNNLRILNISADDFLNIMSRI
jgi:predicted RNA binding protein YcfA (HicA-like mRNA interferase family)